MSELSFDNHNALHYVAGFVPHCLTKRISKGIHTYKESFLQCLSRMGVKGEEEDAGENTFQDFTKKWIRKITGRSFFFFFGER